MTDKLTIDQIYSACYYHAGSPISYTIIENNIPITKYHLALDPLQINKIRAWIAELYTSDIILGTQYLLEISYAALFHPGAGAPRNSPSVLKSSSISGQ